MLSNTGFQGGVGLCEVAMHPSQAVLQYTVQCNGSSECADFTLEQHSLWVTV